MELRLERWRRHHFSFNRSHAIVIMVLSSLSLGCSLLNFSSMVLTVPFPRVHSHLLVMNRAIRVHFFTSGPLHNSFDPV